mgnify:CR=1 FL=1
MAYFANGFKDDLAIIGMGCTKFGERWDTGLDDLIIDAAFEAFEDAGIEPKEVQGCYFANTIDQCLPCCGKRHVRHCHGNRCGKIEG